MFGESKFPVAWILLLALLPAPSPSATTDEEKGRQIALEAEERDQGFGDSAVEVTMTLIDRDGRERTRRLSIKALEAQDPSEGDKSLVVFSEPRDVEGTALLSHSHVGRADDQWLYLPSLKRVKRISSANKSGPFAGSEFAYEDLLSDEVEDFDHRWLRDETCGDLTCSVVERSPRYEDSGYERQTVWIDTVEYRPMRIDFYDRRGELQKTLEFLGYRKFSEKFWRPAEMFMNNLQTGKKTKLSFDDYEFDTGLREQDLSPQSLSRLR